MRPIYSWWRDRRAITAVEFALLAPVMIMLVCGTIELGHMYMVETALEGALLEAARTSAATQESSEASRDTVMRASVTKAMSFYKLAAGKQLTIATTVYGNFSDSFPETYIDQNGNGKYDAPSGSFPGEPFTDRNGNGKWDAAIPKSGTEGQPGDIVSYTANSRGLLVQQHRGARRAHLAHAIRVGGDAQRAGEDHVSGGWPFISGRLHRVRRAPSSLRTNRRGVAFVEFALALPLVLGFTMSGLEMANFVLANNKTQRLATMFADLLAQNGDGPIAATETQVYDLFYALDVSAKPYDMRNNGRAILTVVQGVDANGDGVSENRILNQQFDGGYTAAAPILGCHTASTTPNYTRHLAIGEVLVHAQVSYKYAPLFSRRVYDMLHLPTVITRTAAFRARSKDFAIQPVDGYPSKDNCTSANGL